MLVLQIIVGFVPFELLSLITIYMHIFKNKYLCKKTMKVVKEREISKIVFSKAFFYQITHIYEYNEI